MRVYISYVEQGENDHRHCSEIIDVEPGFYVTKESVVMQIKNWLDQKQNEVREDRKLILLNKFEF
jgi:hypothetical protein